MASSTMPSGSRKYITHTPPQVLRCAVQPHFVCRQLLVQLLYVLRLEAHMGAARVTCLVICQRFSRRGVLHELYQPPVDTEKADVQFGPGTIGEVIGCLSLKFHTGLHRVLDDLHPQDIAVKGN